MPPVDRLHPIRAASSESSYSLMEFMREYPNDAACLEWLWRSRFSPDGENAHCPKCDQERAFKRYKTTQRRQSWTCQTCGHHVHPTAGTIFHKSSTSLHLWFYAMYIMASTRCGVSAKQLERELGVTYKTAWRMFNKIRNEVMTDEASGLTGEVEADETWIGGRMRNADRRVASLAGIKLGPYAKPRTMVFGIVERRGRVRADVLGEGRHGFALHSRIRDHVLPASIVYTDEWQGYSGVERQYTHKRIHHKKRVYVSGDVHTQTIEGFFSLVKNGIRGVYHSVSTKWLQGYLNEYAWRYNRRDNQRAMFLDLLDEAVRKAV
jgi:transposase